MKPKQPSLLLVTAAILCAPLQAQSSFDPTGEQAEAYLPRQIRTEVEYIEMSLEQMTALMADEKASQTDTSLRQHISELIKKEKAEIIESQMVITRSGEKSTTESIQEFIYPTEFEPAQLVNSAKTNDDKSQDDEKLSNIHLATGPTPTAFESRNLGATLEIEPTLGESSQYIELRLMPEIAYHIENIKWASWKDKRGEADIQLPTIYTLRVSTALTLANKKPALVAALSPKDDRGVTDFSRKILIFAKCTVISPGR